jgi:hypothetical protein
MGFRYCLKCKGKINPISNNTICTKCKKQDYIDKNKDRLMKCKICDKEMINLQMHIIKIHRMKIDEYKKKYNVDRVHIYSRESKEKMHKASIGIKKTTPRWNKGLTKETNISLKKMSENKIGKVAWNKGLNKKIDPRLDYERPTSWKKGQTSHNKGLTKETSDSLKRMSEKLKITYSNNPKLQINYRMAQKRKNNIMFVGERKFDWILNKAGYKKDVDYFYNQHIKVYDFKNKKNRWFYPDFLLFNKYIIEIDGPCHDSKEAKEHDKEREEILKSNGYIFLDRIKYDDLKNKTFLHNKILEYITYKLLIFNNLYN